MRSKVFPRPFFLRPPVRVGAPFSKRMLRVFFHAFPAVLSFSLPWQPTFDVLETCRSVERNGTGVTRRCDEWRDDDVVVRVERNDAADDEHVALELAKARPRASAPLVSIARRRDPLLHRARSESASKRGACAIAQRRDRGDGQLIQGRAEKVRGGRRKKTVFLFSSLFLLLTSTSTRAFSL